jgi:preprotein translocase subunit SecE
VHDRFLVVAVVIAFAAANLLWVDLLRERSSSSMPALRSISTSPWPARFHNNNYDDETAAAAGAGTTTTNMMVMMMMIMMVKLWWCRATIFSWSTPL